MGALEFKSTEMATSKNLVAEANRGFFFMPEDNRYKLMAVSFHFVGEMLFNTRVDADQKEIRAIEVFGLPRNTCIQAISIDSLKMEIVFRLYSPDFEEVQPGHPIPTIEPTLVGRRYKVAVPDTHLKSGVAEMSRDEYERLFPGQPEKQLNALLGDMAQQLGVTLPSETTPVGTIGKLLKVEEAKKPYSEPVLKEVSIDDWEKAAGCRFGSPEHIASVEAAKESFKLAQVATDKEIAVRTTPEHIEAADIPTPGGMEIPELDPVSAVDVTLLSEREAATRRMEPYEKAAKKNYWEAD